MYVSLLKSLNLLGTTCEIDVFSLEEDDYNGLFITQSDNSVRNVAESNKIPLDRSDFSSPCISIVLQQSMDRPVYEDISDVNDLEISSSQMDKNDER